MYMELSLQQGTAQKDYSWQQIAGSRMVSSGAYVDL